MADNRKDVEGTLNDFHLAASEADGRRYFSHFTKNAVFLGTDITERWSVEQFKAYAQPHFDKGRGWTYRPIFREVYFSDDGKTAWFDERLNNESYGETRGSGVLQRVGKEWKIAQYHLTLPVPNGLIEKLVNLIEGEER